MSSSLRLIAPLILLSACGGSFTSSGGDAGSAGASKAGAGNGVGGASGLAGAAALGGATVGGAGNGSGGAVAMREPAKHRALAESCGPRSTAGPSPGQGDAAPLPLTCVVDTDCVGGPNGRCLSGRIGRYCSYDTCFEDRDCGSRSVCMCGASTGASNRCLTESACQVDADCPNSWCSPTFGSCGNYSGVIGYACHTPKDECVDDTDCGANSNGSGAYCMHEPMLAHWICSTAQCVG